MQDKKGAAAGTYKFKFEGNTLNSDDTPEDAGVDEGDQIDVRGEGGCSSSCAAVPCTLQARAYSDSVPPLLILASLSTPPRC